MTSCCFTVCSCRTNSGGRSCLALSPRGCSGRSWGYFDMKVPPHCTAGLVLRLCAKPFMVESASDSTSPCGACSLRCLGKLVASRIMVGFQQLHHGRASRRSLVLPAHHGWVFHRRHGPVNRVSDGCGEGAPTSGWSLEAPGRAAPVQGMRLLGTLLPEAVFSLRLLAMSSRVHGTQSDKFPRRKATVLSFAGCCPACSEPQSSMVLASQCTIMPNA